MEQREALLAGLPAMDGAIGAGGQPGHLQFQVMLVGPEPGHRLIRRLTASQVGTGDASLLSRVLHRFETDALAGAAGMPHAIAGGEDVRIVRAGEAIDQDTVTAGNAGCLGQFGIGNRADADDRQIGGEAPSILGQHRADTSEIAFQRRHLRAHLQHDAMPAMGGGEKNGQGCRQSAGQQPVLAFQHRDLLAQLDGRGRRFEADESAADHHHPFRGGQLAAQQPGIV